MTKSGNLKLIRVMSSNECLQRKCVDLSDYNRYLNQIWYRTQMLHCRHAGMAKFTKSVQVKLVNILTYVPILSFKNGVTIP